jgi:hypothetical protein
MDKPTAKAEYRTVLDEICEDYCTSGKYCILKELLVAQHPARRLLVQIKCVDKFKFEQSRDTGTDIGWKSAMQVWVADGYAAAFDTVYGEDIRFRDIYRRTLAGQADNTKET